MPPGSTRSPAEQERVDSGYVSSQHGGTWVDTPGMSIDGSERTAGWSLLGKQQQDTPKSSERPAGAQGWLFQECGLTGKSARHVAASTIVKNFVPSTRKREAAEAMRVERTTATTTIQR